MRHKIIPWLEKQLGRNIRTTIWRAAIVLADEEDFLETLTPFSLTTSGNGGGGAAPLPPALQRRVIRRWLATRGVSEIGFAAVEEVRGLLTKDAPAKVNLSRDQHARRRAGKIFLD